MLLEIFNFLHFVGLAFGLGGSSIAALISRKAEKAELENFKKEEVY